MEDDGEWDFKTYPPELVNWLLTWITASNWQWTPLDILETERQHPGLLTALDIVLWQRMLVKEQMKSDES